jgi:hypothetical protein
MDREAGFDAGRSGFDIYVNDPTEVKDPAKFETEILLPVK